MTTGVVVLGAESVLVRTALVEESLEPPTTTRRTKQRTLDELLDVAEEYGRREIVEALLRLRDLLPITTTSLSSIVLRRRGCRLSLFSIYPGEEELLLVNLQREALVETLGLSEEEAEELVPRLAECGATPQNYPNWSGWQAVAIPSVQSATEFVHLIREANRVP